MDELRHHGLDRLPAGEPLTGGFLHDVRRITLSDGSRVVVKRIGRRSATTSSDRFRLGESVARAAVRHSIPAVPAYLLDDGHPILRVGATGLLFYPNVHGIVLSTAHQALDPALCRRAGELLARIHRMRLPQHPFRTAGESALWDTTEGVPWDRLVAALRHRTDSRLSGEDARLLTYWSQAYAVVLPQLSGRVSVGHGDLAPRNVMAHDHGYSVIDWEHAGLTEPWTELAVVALDWSSGPGGEVCGPAFRAVVRGYLETTADGLPDVNALIGRAGRLLAWFLYNARLALQDRKGPYVERIENTVHLLHVQAETMTELREWFCQVPRARGQR
ncbi:phosphotransferase family protein [Streptomyces cellostaticus]|uniref:phosphotransferase family protein n=1 Tax=Streptomyces cellostaticus TaxID=67285 RepID=UPI002027156A|nr:aminoglycoside phosphotransferase family protein [Streptomyces cellostaticus]